MSDDDTAIAQMLEAWLNMPTYREERRYLEAHRELLEPDCGVLLERVQRRYHASAEAQLDELRPALDAAVAHVSPLSDALWERLFAYGQAMDLVDRLGQNHRLLDDIHRRGDDTLAIRDAYVDTHGSMALDIPAWLEESQAHLRELKASGPAYATSEERSLILRSALARAESDCAPEVVTEIRVRLRSAIDDGLIASSEPSVAQEQVIKLLQQTLRVYTEQRFPQQYASAQNNLGNAYRTRVAGEKSANIQRAIAAYEAALRARASYRFSKDYASTQNNLGNAYCTRITGERSENLKRAIAAYNEALRVYTIERFPKDYASVQNNLGNAYSELIVGEKSENLEHAIAAYERALSIRTFERSPLDYATTQNNLGITYHDRIKGDKDENLERAIAAYEEALRVRTFEDFPQDYAMTQNNLGNVYSDRVRGGKSKNLKCAIVAYDEALRVRTLEHFPQDHAATQKNLGLAAADYGAWARAASAWEATLGAQEFALALSGSVIERDAVLIEGADAATRAAYAHLRVGDPIAAVLAAERGRARVLAETQRLQAGAPERISDAARRTRYIEARASLSRAQIALNLPVTGDDIHHALLTRGIVLESLPEDQETRRQALESAIHDIELARTEAFAEARASFDTTVAEIHAAGDPADFLLAPLDITLLSRAAARGGAGHALVYLVATRWGGMALGVFGVSDSVSAHARVEALDLPELLHRTIFDQIQRPLTTDDNRLIGGYAHAQENTGFGLLLGHWPGETMRERAQALHEACDEAGVHGSLDLAMQQAMRTLGSHLRYAHVLDAPFDAHEESTRFRITDTRLDAHQSIVRTATVNHAFLRVELERSLAMLAEVAVRPLADWLAGQGAKSVTLIPCGELAAFPLAAAEVAPGVTFGERFPTSIAPSARSLLRDEAAHQQAKRRRTAGVASIGNPRVTHQELRWGEAEALTVVNVASALGMPAEARIQQSATKAWLLDQLAHALLVDASCHGVFNSHRPLDSSLALAGVSKATRLTLRELLNQGIEAHGLLFGLRLLILSACQTGILDLRGAQDEMRSLTAGVLEAGADAAMGALWSVDDKATYLLIVRFAQLWLPHMETMSPAAALARAQHWLRTVTNRELRDWRANELPEPTEEEKRKAGSVEPERDPWREEEAEIAAQPAGAARLIAVRGPGDRLADPDEDEWVLSDTAFVARGERQERYDPDAAQELMRLQASRAADLDACPYSHPYYWAPFQITGW